MMKLIPTRSLADDSPAAETRPNDNKVTPLSRQVALNRFCTTLVSPDNQARFRAFPDAYCRDFNLTLEQSQAVTDLDIYHLLRLGTTLPNLALLVGLYGLEINELCQEQTGRTIEEVRKLLDPD